MGLYYHGEAREVKNYIEDILNGYIKNFSISSLKARINSLYTKQALSVLQYNDLMDYVYAFSASENKTKAIKKESKISIKNEDGTKHIVINTNRASGGSLLLNKVKENTGQLIDFKNAIHCSDVCELVTQEPLIKKNITPNNTPCGEHELIEFSSDNTNDSIPFVPDTTPSIIEDISKQS